MKIPEKILYPICAGLFLTGFSIIFIWEYYRSKIFGLILVIISLVIFYTSYQKKRVGEAYAQTDLKNVLIGILLIFVDIVYNVFTRGHFGFIDFGLLASGTAIILLNTGGLGRALKLEKKIILFSTYFLFILTVIYASVFTGISILYTPPQGLPQDYNPFFDYITDLTIKTSAFFLGIFKPTTAIDKTIDFGGFRVGIWYPCSGVESITVFLSAVIGYYVASNKRDTRKFALYSIVGVVVLFFVNVLRIMIIMVVGYYFGTEAMMFFHTNLGWIMFVIGMGIFWYLVMDDF
jgi:archaeosortase C (PEF-CTERM variant)